MSDLIEETTGNTSIPFAIPKFLIRIDPFTNLYERTAVLRPLAI